MNILVCGIKKPLLTCILLAVFTVTFASPYKNEKNDYVLIINSYSESNPWSRMFTTPVYERLNMDDENITAYTEHLDMLIIDKQSELDSFTNDLLHKYSEKPPLLVVFLGNSSYVLLHDILESKWGEDIPFLLCVEKDFIGPREFYLAKKALPENQRQMLSDLVRSRRNLTVMYVPENIVETVSLMKNCIPDMNRLLFLSDRKYISKQNQETMKSEMVKFFPEISLELITAEDYRTEELIDILQSSDKRTGILYYSWSLLIRRGTNEIISADTYRMLSSYTSLPVFTLNDMDITENGMVGGYFYPKANITETMAKTIDELLNGKVYNMIIMPSGPLPVISYPVLMKKNLQFSACPPNTIFYMKPPTFWELYRYYVYIGGIVAAFLVLILTLRIKSLNKKRLFQEKELKLMSSYSRLVNNMPITYMKQHIIFDDSGNAVDYITVETNPEFDKKLCPSESIIGKKGSEVHDGQLKNYLNACNLVLKHNKKVTSQYYFKQTDRYFSLIMISASEADNIDVFMVDMTELMKTQQLLRTVNNKLSMSLDVANIVPWRWDLVKKVILCDVNKPVELGSAHIDENLLTVPDSQYFARIHKSDRAKVERAYAELISGKVDKITEEYRVYNPDKGLHGFDWIEARAAVDKRDENGRPISLIGSSLAITDRKKIEQELIQAKNKAEESNRLKSAFLANMSHEIRTPLNAIVGFSNILATTDAEEEKEEYISIIENNNALLLQLISDILDLSKIEAGTLEFVYEDVDINLLFRELEQSMQLRAHDGVQVIFEHHLPECFVSIPKSRLIQVVTNLMTNAIKFTNTGSIRFGFTVQDGKQFRFYVSDTGCGIPKNQQDKIFERFVKLNSFAQGTGLGLSICRMIVDYLGGEINVKSEEGKGSTFWFTIPYHPAIKKEKVESEYEKKRVDQNRLVVLIAEDNPDNFKLFESILKYEFEIIHAWNGKEAVELFKLHAPHIVLMDINMPEMNGYEATEEIRKISKDIPIIAVTAYAFASDEQQIMRSGFDAYTSKPLNASALKKQMIDLLGKRLFLV